METTTTAAAGACFTILTEAFSYVLVFLHVHVLGRIRYVSRLLAGSFFFADKTCMYNTHSCTCPKKYGNIAQG